MSCPSSTRRRDSNPRPLERESPPITTRPGHCYYPVPVVYPVKDHFFFSLSLGKCDLYDPESFSTLDYFQYFWCYDPSQTDLPIEI